MLRAATSLAMAMAVSSVCSSAAEMGFTVACCRFLAGEAAGTEERGAGVSLAAADGESLRGREPSLDEVPSKSKLSCVVSRARNTSSMSDGPKSSVSNLGLSVESICSSSLISWYSWSGL
uniref:Putative secreted protein n=1 Tax=Ixodes ricinus TaxID=34613 RepID=A0A6B0UMY9_IXORI